MRRIIPLLTALLFCTNLTGCASSSADSDLPPGVRKNENRATEVGRKGKPFLVEKGKPSR